MTWGLYADQAMSARAQALTLTMAVGDAAMATARVWFGAPIAGSRIESASQPGVGQVVARLVSSVGEWEAETDYQSGARIAVNGLVFVAATTGISGASPPSWPESIGDLVSDGTVAWSCVAVQDTPDEYRLALTEAGLSTATPGASLELGTSIDGGSAVAIWVGAIDVGSAVQTQSHVELVIDDVQEVQT